jgi:hypothetical protein
MTRAEQWAQAATLLQQLHDLIHVMHKESCYGNLGTHDVEDVRRIHMVAGCVEGAQGWLPPQSSV